MEIIYYKDPVGNFGDDLNDWLWDELVSDKEKIHPNKKVLGVGSILDANIIKNNHVTVLGSGVGYGTLPNKHNLSIKFVRGKLTARVLGIDESFAVADSAILLNCLEQFKPIPENERQGIIFIPHHHTLKHKSLINIFKNTGIDLISPTLDAKYVINKIRKAKLVIAEAMHAAIIADTMRVRWIPVVCSNNINTFKWLDWLSMFDLEYNPVYTGLPDLREEKLNLAAIRFNRCLYKPNYKNMKMSDLIYPKEATFITKVLHKLNVIYIKNAVFSAKKQRQHENNFLNKFMLLVQGESCLSKDTIFCRNRNNAKTSLDEFIKTGQ